MDCHGMMDGMAQCMQTAPWGLVCPHGKVSLEMLKDASHAPEVARGSEKLRVFFHV